MIKIDFPLFKIPDANKSNAKKPGWGTEPKFFWEKKNFEDLKRQRVSDIDSMINTANRTQPFSSKLWDKAFFEMKFHPKALAKSAQPKKLLEKYNIDTYAHKKEWIFYATSTLKNLTEFRNWISKLSSEDKEWAFLSAITDIKPISKEEKWLVDDLTQQKVFIYLPDTLSESECKNLYDEAVKKYKIQKSEYFVSNCNAKIIYGCFPSNFLNDISDEVRWPAQKIEKVYDIQVSKTEVSNYQFSDIKIETPLLDAYVVVVDSWIKQHSFMKDLIQEVHSSVQEDKSDKYHWTMVWSRVLFGHYILDDLKKNNNTLTAEVKLVDLHVLGKETPSSSCSVDPKDLIKTRV